MIRKYDTTKTYSIKFKDGGRGEHMFFLIKSMLLEGDYSKVDIYQCLSLYQDVMMSIPAAGVFLQQIKDINPDLLKETQIEPI